MNTPKTFRVNGHTFRVIGGEVQYYLPDFADTGFGGMGGIWSTIAKVAGAGALIYTGYSVATGTGSFGDRISNVFSGISDTVKNILPSSDTLNKAIAVGGSILGANAATAQQQAVIAAQQSAQQQAQQNQQAQNEPQQTSNNIPYIPVAKDNTLLYAGLGGAALLILMLGLRK